MVRRTAVLEEFLKKELHLKARQVLGRTHPDVITRAATFLLLSDSRSSFGIEGENPSHDRAVAGEMDPVAAAAALAFGFVYIHPFEDGNWRLHRWLIHHLLSKAGYNPSGVVFPISAVMLRELHVYRQVLESYSKPLLQFIEWKPTGLGTLRF